MESFAILLAVVFGPALRADQVPTVQTLQIVDLGNYLILNWNFYYGQFPARFVLEEKQSEAISLEDSGTLEQNLSDVVSVAFELRINGEPVKPEKIASLSIAPNKFCTAKVIYPGRPGGRLEVRAPVLKYLPATDVINYSIVAMGKGNASEGVTGDLTAQKGPFSQVIEYREVAHGSATSMPLAGRGPASVFKSELRIPWINANWLFITMILLLAQRPGRVVALVFALIAAWIAICMLRAAGKIAFPWRIPELALGVPTAALGVVAAKFPGKWTWLAGIAFGAAILNAWQDLRQLAWAALGMSAVPALCLGFAVSMAAMVLVLVALVWECRKYPEFETDWAPRLCWVVSALAILLPAQKWLFG